MAVEIKLDIIQISSRKANNAFENNIQILAFRVGFVYKKVNEIQVKKEHW